tara:strand:- start:967 stop:1338 length:372 start_codon:yes stop_codon:yes gene_type:complete
MPYSIYIINNNNINERKIMSYATSSLNEESIETAVRLKQGIAEYDLAQLNEFVGSVVMQLAQNDGTVGGVRVKSAIKKVAKEEFAKKHGKAQVSWVDYAEEYADNVSENFCLEGLHALRTEKL